MTVQLLVTIQVKNFTALESFERQAVTIMKDHGGRIVSAFEVLRNDDGTGEEIHLVEFPSIDDFHAYRQDPRSQSLASLRADAATGIDIKISSRLKHYS